MMTSIDVLITSVNDLSYHRKPLLFGVMEVAVTDTNSSNKGRQANNRICNEKRGDVTVWKVLLTFICQLVVSTPLI